MTSSDRPAAARVVALEHLLALLQVHLYGGRFATGSEMLADLVHRVSAILGAKVAIVLRQGDAWTVRAESEGDATLPTIDARSRFGELVALAMNETACLVIGDREWTIAARGPQATAAVLVEGDWTSAASTLQAVAGNVALAWHAHASQARERARMVGCCSSLRTRSRRP